MTIMIKTATYPTLGQVKYFGDYYSNYWASIKQLTSYDYRFRNAIYNFKDGIASQDRNRLIDVLIEYLSSIPGINDGSHAFFCLPASTEEATAARYGDMIKRLKSALPNLFIINDRVKFTGSKTSKHSSYIRDVDACAHITMNNKISQPHTIIFDDIITRGDSMNDAKRFLERHGAKSVECIAFGKNYYPAS